MSKRRKFSAEFKRGAVKQASQRPVVARRRQPACGCGRPVCTSARRGTHIAPASTTSLTRPGECRQATARRAESVLWRAGNKKAAEAAFLPNRRAGRRPSGIRVWWWGGTLRQTYVTQRLTTASNSCGKVRNPAPTANNPTSSHLRLASAMCRESAASSIPVCGIEPASASTHPTFDQAVTNRSRKARRPWS